MKKRITSIFLCICLMLSAISTDVFAAETVEKTTDTVEWEYEIYGEGLTLTKYNGSELDVHIPELLKDEDGIMRPVLKLGPSLFENNDALNSVTLSTTVEEIGARAFYDADNLITVVTSEYLTHIDVAAFSECDSFNSIILYDDIVSIGKNAFLNCPNLVIYCNVATVGYDYALQNDIPCERLNEDIVIEDDNIYEENGFVYKIVGSELHIVGYQGAGAEVLVPETIRGMDVVVIDGAFRNNTEITHVELPDTLREITGAAFQGCKNLQSVHLPEKLDKIGNYTFKGCGLDEVVLKECTTYGWEVFADCDNITNIVFSNSMTSVPRGMFSNCDSLKSVIIPEGIVSISSNAFLNCTALENVELPETLTAIYPYAFMGCKALSEVELPDNVVLYNSYYEGDGQYLISDHGYTFGDYTILKVHPLTTTYYSVCENAINWEYCDNLEYITVNSITYLLVDGYAYVYDVQNGAFTEITIPEKVQTYVVAGVMSAFRNCTQVLSVSLPDTITEIGMYAFEGCTSLTTINIPANVSFIGAYAFKDCSSLQDVAIPKNVAVINYETFSGCTGLRSVELPEGLTSIENRAFFKCSSLKEMSIPDSVLEIGEHAFYYCSSLQTVDLSSQLDVIEKYTFYQCENLTTIEIPQNVTKLGDYAFYHCSKLTEINIPQSVTQIDASAFSDCESLTEIKIPGNVKKIGRYAFADCHNVTKVTLEEGVEYIGKYAFGFFDCESIYLPDSIKYLDNEDGSFDADTILIYSPRSEVMKYMYSTTNLFVEGERDAKISHVTEGNINYCIVGDKAVAMSCLDKTIAEAVVPQQVNGATVVATYKTFEECENLCSVELPDTIEMIGFSTFNMCSSLVQINMPKQLKYIGPVGFLGCVSMESLEFPETIKGLGYYSFYCCNKLEEIYIPSCLKDLSTGSFIGCSSLKKVYIANGVKEIGEAAFGACDALTTVILPNSITTIGEMAFAENPNLKTILIPENVSYMGENIFMESNTNVRVYQDSYAHKYVASNEIDYTVLVKSDNPEISYGCEITGTVLRSMGETTDDIVVGLLYANGTLKESTTANADGFYAFDFAEVGTYTIRACDSLGNVSSVQVAVKRMNAFDVFLSGDTNLTLKNGHSISGMVSEYPANVTLNDCNGNAIAQVESQDGTFVIENVANGTYIIKAETQNGSASQEITVFDEAVSDLTLTVTTSTASIWGYVDVEDRTGKHHRRNWVDVTLYNEEGIVVAHCKSDNEGKYSFDKLPMGEYVIVAETAEMRPDKKYDYERSHKLKGYAYVDVIATTEYQADTIVLCEDNDYQVNFWGKVTAHGGAQSSEVTLTNVFHQEVATCATGRNGKYRFDNVKDGLYFVTAVTENNGMGFTVIAIRGGKVYGDTDITVYKSEKIKKREDKFKNEIPKCNSREEALQYRDRIAEEKHFYDGLSEKEKKQVSKAYVNRLNQYSEWIAGCECVVSSGSENITAEFAQSGMIVSGQDLEEIGEDESIVFHLNIEKKSAHEKSKDGVNTRDDYIQHSMEDVAEGCDIVDYYEISMTKACGDTEREITSVYKDTDAMGKFRITLTIPEEYRGRKHYSFLHVHCGEVVTLVDLDDDPNTVTFEVDKFSTFALVATDEELGRTIPMGDLDISGTVDESDADAMRKILVGITKNYDADDARVNEDEMIDSRDLVSIKRKIK